MGQVKRNRAAVAAAERADGGKLRAMVAEIMRAERDRVTETEAFRAWRVDVAALVVTAGGSMEAPGVEWVPLGVLFRHGVSVADAARECLEMARAWAAGECAE